MTLLTEVMERPLDGGYAEVAARKRAGEKPLGPGRWLFPLVLALILGVAATWGVKVLRTPGEEGLKARQALETRAEAAREQVRLLSQQSNQLSNQVQALQNQALSQSDPSAGARARELAIRVGAVPVQGPGLEIKIAPGPAAQERGQADQKIRAGDLRLIVGSLWQAGAEAVAVGGVRLAGNTAIRDVGDQIQAGFEPLASPFVIQAIGPADGLEVGLAQGRAGDRISLLKGYLGASVTIEPVRDLELPASAEVATLYYSSGKE
jgi:uncharacterized protein YlxW (UPF0749 family)